jgi:hypothetical protein
MNTLGRAAAARNRASSDPAGLGPVNYRLTNLADKTGSYRQTTGTKSG